MMKTDWKRYWQRAAEERVDADEELKEHRGLLIEYAWPNAWEHYEWVVCAEKRELLDWATSVTESGPETAVSFAEEMS